LSLVKLNGYQGGALSHSPM